MFQSWQILGAGGYGVILGQTQTTSVYKLLYDVNACQDIQTEAEIQSTAQKVLEGLMFVPRILSVRTEPVVVQGIQYLCGIEMERFPSPLTSGEQIHIVFDGTTDSLNLSLIHI